LIKGLYLKHAFVGMQPPQLVNSASSQVAIVKAVVKRGHQLHLPIMEQPEELDIPLDGTIREHHVICYRRSLIGSNGIQHRKGLFEGSIPTPDVLPKMNPRALARDKTAMVPKDLPSLTDVFPEAHPMRTRDSP
jgi:hypothetical protein